MIPFRKVITLPAAFAEALLEEPTGKYLELPVIVDWFPPLTASQELENASAVAHGDSPPHPDPNVVIVRCPIPGDVTVVPMKP